MRHESVDLTQLLIDAVSDAHAADPDHRWLLEVDQPVEVTGDEDRLRQVLVNLLGNARRHTPPGTTVTASLERVPGVAVVRIVDDGPGIAPELQSRLFERFSRGDPSQPREADGTGPGGGGSGPGAGAGLGAGARSGGSAGGTGLGLSISQAIVAAHDGEIDVISHPGRTVFTIRLPAADGLVSASSPADDPDRG